MAAASRSESSSNQEFFILDDEDEGDFSTLSDPYGSRVDFSSISSSITSKSLASFLQTLSEVYKPPSNENWLLTLAKEAVFNDSKSVLKVIPQFCIAHFYCAHLITYNFSHYTYHLKKIYNFMTILYYFKTSLVTFVQRITLKSMFSKKAYKSVARVPVSVVYLFTCISRFNATIP
jgi:hypothetical protein